MEAALLHGLSIKEQEAEYLNSSVFNVTSSLTVPPGLPLHEGLYPKAANPYKSCLKVQSNTTTQTASLAIPGKHPEGRGSSGHQVTES